MHQRYHATRLICNAHLPRPQFQAWGSTVCGEVVFADSRQTSSAVSFIIRPSKLKGTYFTVLLTFDSHMELWSRTKQRNILH